MKLAAFLCILGIPAFTLAAVPDKKSIELLKDPKGQKVSIKKEDVLSLERLEKLYTMDARTPGLQEMIKKNTLKHAQKAVPVLIKVMKESKYPDQNRWQATMLLGQIMGKNSAPFIAKFADHPNWMMRVASLKALLGLKQDQYKTVYAKALKDPSLIVRVQALDNISQLKIKELGPNVWEMMYDQTNYSGSVGNRKRTSIVRSIIRTLGDLRYEQASRPLAKLIQKPKYQDLIEDLDYSLEKITGQVSPDATDARRKFWSKLATVENKKI